MLAIDQIHYSVKSSSGGIRKIIDGLCLNVPSKNWISLIGPNGCGKSTLLHLAAGLLKPSSGIIEWKGQSPGQKIWDRTEIGLLFQDLGLLDHLSVFKNLKIANKSKKSEEQRAHDLRKISERLFIDKLLDQKVYKLSGGEKQRVAIARLFLQKPQLVLLDEPLNSLDGAARETVIELLLEWKATGESTAIHVTHQMDEACLLGDKIGVMREGQISCVETPENLYFSPPSIELARALSFPSMNFISTEALRKLSVDLDIRLEGETLGFRPNSVVLNARGEVTEDISHIGKSIILPCKYIGCETYWGKVTHLVKVEGIEVVVRSEERWVEQQTSKYSIGDSLTITIPQESIISFNQPT